MQAKSTKPPARFNEGSLLKSMETAGKMVDDEEAAEAREALRVGRLLLAGREVVP